MSTFRAKKAGVALKVQKKLELRYDEEDALGTPARIVQWMNTVLKGEHPECYGTSWRKIQFYMRDGTALCKLISKLRVADGMSPVKFNKNSLTPFIALENIESFTKATGEYGVEQELLFQNVDLYDGIKGPFIKVIDCLNKLGFLANAKGFTPQFEAVEAKKPDTDGLAST